MFDSQAHSQRVIERIKPFQGQDPYTKAFNQIQVMNDELAAEVFREGGVDGLRMNGFTALADAIAAMN